MKNLILPFFAALTVSACDPPASERQQLMEGTMPQEEVQAPKENLQAIATASTAPSDSDAFVTIAYNPKWIWIFKNCKNAQMSEDERKAADKLLNDAVVNYNTEREKKFTGNKKDLLLIDLSKYKRQYVAVINKKGEKHIFINCFCSPPDESWKKKIVEVEDGGICFFNLKVNLKDNKYYEFFLHDSR